MNKKRFNDYQCPKQFMTYMSRLEDKRRTIISDDHYVLQNAELLRKYRKSRSESVRTKIKETLFWVNLKFLHEIFMKKLNPNLFRYDVLDIYQELCVSLIEGINDALKRKNLDTKTLSTYIWGRLMIGVNKIIKEYYDPSNCTEFLENPDSLEFEYPEHHEIERRIYRYLTDRERAIINEIYFKDKGFEEVGDMFGLTRERIRQLQEKAFKKIRQAIEDSNATLDLNIKFRKDIFKILKQYPGVRWIVFEGPYQPKVDLRAFELYGINPKQFLIISELEPIGKSYYNREQYNYSIPNQYYGNIYDSSLVATSEVRYPFKYDIFRELKKIGRENYLPEFMRRRLAIDTIYKRELQK